MNHPTPEACRSVAQVFYTLDEQFKEVGIDAQIDMMNPHLDDNDCGTVGCHGGWYALGKSNVGTNHHRLDSFQSSYVKGAAMMSKDLGLVSKHTMHVYAQDKLEQWADENPEQWGNIYGDSMFASIESFFLQGEFQIGQHRDTEDLSFFGDWWSGVADRIEQENAHNKTKQEIAELRRTGRNI